MDVVALVVSLLALGLAGWSAWATHRQAQATEEQATAAKEANQTADEALALARKAEERDEARLVVEERPTFDVTGKPDEGKASALTVAVTNTGPLPYEKVLVRPDLTDAETKRIVHGMGDTENLCNESDLGACKPGETLRATLVRTNPDLGGKAKLIVTASRSGREWHPVYYVDAPTPPRVYFV